MQRNNTCFLGIDTSNYTTSCALYDTAARQIRQQKQLLPVAPGERGLRQSDALFHHTRQLPEQMRGLFSQSSGVPAAIGVSARPRDVQGSYMPCFLAGVGTAESLCAVLEIPCYSFSHQAGHLTAALFSADRLDLLRQSFLAFHLSGGTTELLLVQPDAQTVFSVTCLGGSSDLNAGQLIDRVGVKLGLPFPAGIDLDRLAQQSVHSFSLRPSLKNFRFSLSGLENRCAAMQEKGESPADIALFCLESLCAAVAALAHTAREAYGALPILFAGGVASNTLLRQHFAAMPDSLFAQPAFSADNAAGVAILAAMEYEKGNK